MDHDIFYVGGGCFWGVEAVYRKFLGKGVVSTEVGYIGGTKHMPTYEEVCTGTTGYLEAVRVEYDPSVLSHEKVLDLLFQIHDPTSKDKQGNDTGSQYRSAIFYITDDQEEAVNSFLHEAQNKYDKSLQTEVGFADTWYPAEDYHQQYLEKNPGGYCHVNIDGVSLS